ncbi:MULTISPECIES: thioredoxin domain-containing protein [unclassified Arthrobacter]|uniref:thioredoxin family protein n=1 Tax=unclassified Arthrobacter TaxID=235627 RepID=UPI001486C3C3
MHESAERNTHDCSPSSQSRAHQCGWPARPGLILLDFRQASCAPCRALETRVEQFARRRPGAFTGYRIDIDTDPGTATTYDVQSIPTLICSRMDRKQGGSTDSSTTQTWKQLDHTSHDSSR